VAEGILGIKADFKGLSIDPCIPKGWKGFTASRKFRGVEYQIEVKNPCGICKGVKKVTVDGKAVTGNVGAVRGRQEGREGRDYAGSVI
jgi:cellobiose phosphorylase